MGRRLIIMCLVMAATSWAIYDLKNHDINQWLLPVSNYGEFGQTGGGAEGGEWPRGSGHYYIFGAGLWIGAIAPNGDTLVTVGYNPNSGGNEVVPGLFRQGTSTPPYIRVYKFPGDWPPPSDTFPMAPQIPLTTQETWACFNDNDSVVHDTRPLGFDTYQTGFADTTFIVRDVVYLKYEVKNCTTYTMSNTYLGLTIDADVGTASDDVNGLILRKWFSGINDTIKNLGFTTNSAPQPGWGAVAILFLKTPRNLGLTAFKAFTIDVDPRLDWQRYKMLAGYNYQSGLYEPYDSIDPGPADKRFMMCSGPFDIAPGQKEELVIAVIGADFDYVDTLPLARTAHNARLFWERITGIAENEHSRNRARAVNLDISPNPARNSIRISYTLTRGGLVALRLFDASGRLVETLYYGQVTTGTHRITLRNRVKAGVHFIHLQTEQGAIVKKITVVP